MTTKTIDPIGSLDAIDIELFDDAQFLREPRLRLLQQAFHSLRRTKEHWAAIGVMGSAGQNMTNPRWRMAEALANANLQRATLYDYQHAQVQIALAKAKLLKSLVFAHGQHAQASDIPTKTPEWSDLDNNRLDSQLHLDDRGIWLTQTYDPAAQAALPAKYIGSTYVRWQGIVPVTCLHLPCVSEMSHNRALEYAELGRWGLRQPRYVPS